MASRTKTSLARSRGESFGRVFFRFSALSIADVVAVSFLSSFFLSTPQQLFLLPPLKKKKNLHTSQLRPAAPEVRADGPQDGPDPGGAPQAEEEARGGAGQGAREPVRRRDQAAQAPAGRRPEVCRLRVLPRRAVRQGVQVQVLARPGGGAQDAEDRPVLRPAGGRRGGGGGDGGLGPR